MGKYRIYLSLIFAGLIMFSGCNEGSRKSTISGNCDLTYLPKPKSDVITANPQNTKETCPEVFTIDCLGEDIKNELTGIIDDLEIKHPMIVINQQEVAIVKNRIKNKIEPQYSAYLDLMENAQEALSFEPNAPDTIEIQGGYYYDPAKKDQAYVVAGGYLSTSNAPQVKALLGAESYNAYTCALAYTYSGEDKYADKTIEILMDWADKNTTFTGGDRGLKLGNFSPLGYAADFIYDYEGWDKQDRQKFLDWWEQQVHVHTYEVVKRKDNNWKDAGMIGLFTSAVLLEDKELLLDGVSELRSYFVKRYDKGVRRTDGYWKIQTDGNCTYLPREVRKRKMKGDRGVTYTQYALTSMVQIFEAGRYAGCDFWDLKTDQGVGLEELINDFFGWQFELDKFPFNDNPVRFYKRYNTFELAKNNLNVREEMKDWLSKNRPVSGGDGDVYITLNKGDLYRGDPVRKRK